MGNNTKRKLKEGKAVVGSIVQIDNLFTTEMMGKAGFDFLLIDTQHSPIGVETLHSLIKGLSPTESDIIVRAVWNDTWLVNQCVDVGADGVIIPLTNTAEDVKRAVAAAHYPPIGVRSFGPRKIDRYASIDEYHERSFEDTLVLPQIESREAMENIDEILQVDGVDGIMVGPNDLALTHGLPPGIGKPAADPLIQKVLDKCKEHGVPFGMFTMTYEVAEKWLSRGGQIAVVGGDLGFVAEGAERTARQVKELVARLEADA